MLRKTIIALTAACVAAIGWAGQARADGLIVVSNPPVTVPGHFAFAPLEVVYHKVECQIKDQVAVTSVDQAFYNPNGGRPLEGEYIFPVPKDAQINKFAMEIDGKTMEAELLPADKARKIYEDIVRQSKDPALLEYAGRAMFKVHIFPIEANSTKRITLKYTEFLKQDSNLLDYHYTLNTEKYSSKPIKNVSMKITIESSTPITTLYSPTHEVDKNKHDETHAVVGYEAKDVRPDTDFHLYIGRKAAPVGFSVMTYKPDADKDGYFVMMAAPALSKEVKALPKDVIFVVDTSGSMSGPKIEQAKKALKFCVNTMNTGDRFDIVRFSTEAEPLFKSLSAYNDDNKKKALEFADGLRASGGTAIEDAINAAMDERGDTNGQARMFMVVFLTDGQPTVGEQNIDKLIAQAKKKGNDVRMFSFGIGTDVNTKLLDAMAEQSKGYSQYVLPQEDIEVAVSNFFGKVQDPVIAGVKVDFGAAGALKMYPKEMPDLFKGDQLVVFGTYSKSAKSAVVLKGMVNGKEETFAQDVEFADKTDSSNEWIGKLWAARRVGYLLDEIRVHGESKEVKDEVVELARKWGIVTPYTAMLIIEDERRRGLPVASRSLREMEVDDVAVANGVRGQVANNAGAESGGIAVNNAIHNGQAKRAESLDGLDRLAAQSGEHDKWADAGAKGAASGAPAPREALRKSEVGLDQSAKAQLEITNATPATVAPAATYTLRDAQVAAAGPGEESARGGGRGGFGGGGAGDASDASVKFAGTIPLSGKNTYTGGTGVSAGTVTFDGGTINNHGTLDLKVQGGTVSVYDAGKVTAKDLNLGNQATNSWNYQARTDDEKKAATGYRIVGNYAQQNRVVNNREFYLNGNQWTDNNVQVMTEKKKDAKKNTIKFGSDEYFKLLQDHPEAAQYMSLGNNVTFEVAGEIYDVVDETPATK